MCQVEDIVRLSFYCMCLYETFFPAHCSMCTTGFSCSIHPTVHADGCVAKDRRPYLEPANFAISNSFVARFERLMLTNKRTLPEL